MIKIVPARVVARKIMANRNCLGVTGLATLSPAAGARLTKVALPEAAEARARFLNGGLFGVEGLSVLEEHLPQWVATLDPNIGARFEAARQVSAVTYFTEQRKLGALARAVDERLGQYDALVVPTVPITPPTLAEMADAKAYGHANMMMTRNTQPVNLLGLCAVTMPVALDAAAMPVGMQLIGRRHADTSVLAASAAFEQIRPWHDTYLDLERKRNTRAPDSR